MIASYRMKNLTLPLTQHNNGRVYACAELASLVIKSFFSLLQSLGMAVCSPLFYLAVEIIPYYDKKPFLFWAHTLISPVHKLFPLPFALGNVDTKLRNFT